MTFIYNSYLNISLIPLHIIVWTTHDICLSSGSTNSFSSVNRSRWHPIFFILLFLNSLRMLISLYQFYLFLWSFSNLNGLLITKINLLMLFLCKSMRIWRLKRWTHSIRKKLLMIVSNIVLLSRLLQMTTEIYMLLIRIFCSLRASLIIVLSQCVI